ncbi:DUF1559 family PulG-like putative transporter [Planctomicrobium piriforme]|uniref:Prepilin-type N-terminal cleavage/methylation domain-containing protein/prepilin-type processing-associated H-X9-DG domain-containing protein n=1 Tax=Planctomicrobium piriforme TaxID=1576369 RepID=A0A1I3GMG3_9PLAN|nr:DUF1559 domain-containing protein [Planctomicrobium piriforme]SFI24600.1 prepilin-type N-terminal cleavage/methylation domain-containing protein/prepilin-type processing-associated H-X9-DG domain-containing protein [Planctomicrobium piriforme]
MRRSVRIIVEERAAFTMIELLVTLGIVSLLLSLALPSMFSARASARRLACQNNLRQVALALLSHADQHNRLPAAGHFAAQGSDQYHNWVIAILPYLDQTALYIEYDLAQPAAAESNLKVTSTSIPILVCPDDVSVVDGQGNLSYVVSGGLAWTIPVDCPASLHADTSAVMIAPLDLNGDGEVCPVVLESSTSHSGNPKSAPLTDLACLEQTSLFFVENWPAGTGTGRHHRLSDIQDGASQTMLMTENVRAGYDPKEKFNWGSSEPSRSMFFVSSTVCEAGICEPESVELGRANDAEHPLARRECLNSSLHQAEGTAPWPSSGHPGVVNVAWCDGRVTVLSDRVDGGVYFASVTPQGLSKPHPLAESVITDAAF